ncbi:hypothetical protein QZM18_25535 [Burkholderia diffusa]|nr:hypothetical protein [Burkholderia diffusa]MDN7907454.1 hypothetical protein [Burkholderia diffusa]
MTAPGAKPVVHFNESEVLCRHSLKQVVKWSNAATMKDALA